MSLDLTVTKICVVLFVVGVFVALWRRDFSRRNRKNRDMGIGILLTIAGFACMASVDLLF